MTGENLFRNRKILLGVTGSISAYKSVVLLRRLTEAGAQVTVVMTPSAQRFVAPLTFEVLSGRKVQTDLFAGGESMQHLSLAEESDLIFVVPATANIIGKLANGVADDLLTTILLASRAPVVIGPAMDGHMWNHPALQKNILNLEGMGHRIVYPEEGPLASGKTGIGRLAKEESFLAAAKDCLTRKKDLKNEVILVTAGPTREPLDPVRFISNRSSGKMGYAIARAALDRGARVILISGPSMLVPPKQAELVRVETAEEMRQSTVRFASESTVIIMAAAVSDYRSRKPQTKKVKKKQEPFSIELEPVPDILMELAAGTSSGSPRGLLVGFVAETGNLVAKAKEKLMRKRLDLVVGNDVTVNGAGFDGDTNIVTLIDRINDIENLPKLSKLEVANRILDRIKTLLHMTKPPKTGAAKERRNA